jgi:hypothetical protein
LQVIDKKIVLAFEHFQHLQLQNDHLVMQNHLLVRTPRTRNSSTLIIAILMRCSSGRLTFFAT